MTSESPAGVASPPPADAPLDLAALRAEIDDIDSAILDHLTRRRALTEKIGRAKTDGETWLRLKPDREAHVLSRLLERVEPHARTLTRAVWREIMAAGLAAQEELEVVVWAGEGATHLMAEARSRFGAHPRCTLVDSPETALAAADAGTAVAVLTLNDPWWTRLSQEHPNLWAFELLEAERPGEVAALALGRIDPATLADGPVLRVVQGGDAEMSLRPRRELRVEGAWSLRAEAGGPEPTLERRDAGIIGRAPILPRA